MARWFNTAGPCRPDLHYMLPPATRLPTVKRLIDQQGYFVIHAPRQVGKTTTMAALAQELTAKGGYCALLVSTEMAVPLGDRLEQAEQAMLDAWWQRARQLLPVYLQPPALPPAKTGNQLGLALAAWAEACARPVVLFIDEIDALEDWVLISVLRQLRANYAQRPDSFPQSVALIGLRDVRDYKVASGGSERLHTASPFNIKIESLTLGNFTPEEVATLYAQHSEDTGQVFTPAATQLAYHLSNGHPWLVNALARQAVEVVAPDPTIAITEEHIQAAKELLIQRRDTHIDSLASRIREPRIKSILEPMLAGQPLGDVPVDDIEFVLDLGLCRLDETGSLVIANPIYREVMPRMLAYSTTVSLNYVRPTWLTETGDLDQQQLLEAFLAFWRQHGQPLLQNVNYHEVAPHIVMMAFLHRVVNGEGRLEREYAIGTDRMDLCLRYRAVTLGIELKVWRSGRPDPLAAGLEQLDQYLAGLGLQSGWLVIFDQRDGVGAIADRTSSEIICSPQNRAITLIRG